MSSELAAKPSDGGRPVRGYIDGCFDIMHSGHYNAIRQAKAVCDVLVVGVHSDDEIALNKALPVMKQEERYALLEHIKWMDEIIHDVPYSPLISTLDRANADFCVHGDDMPVNSEGVCAYDTMRDAGRLRIVRRTEGVSTTDLIGRLITIARDNQPAAETQIWSELQKNRVGAADAIRSIVEAEAAPKDSAINMVSRLVEKYGISPEDAEGLRAVAEAAGSSVPTTLPAGADKEGSMRTKVPVQLLASTRRIIEFASSRQPSRDDKVVYVSGSFDMFHVGHAQFLKDAREKGSFLLVGIHDDSTVSQLRGSRPPVMNLHERVLNVCACKWVDEVILAAPKTVTEDLIKTWDVTAVVRGVGHMRNSFACESSTDYFEVAKKLGIYVEVPSRWPELCQETVVKRIVQNREVYMRRNADRARREDAYYKSKDQSKTPQEV